MKKTCLFEDTYICTCWACGDEYESKSKDSHYCRSCLRDPFGVATYSGDFEYGLSGASSGRIYLRASVDENGVFTIRYD